MESVPVQTRTNPLARKVAAAVIITLACLSPAGTAFAAGSDTHARCMGPGLSTAAPGIIAPA